MKLLKLELCNFRGVRSDLCIEPNGENMVVLGPNGTGKSTLVDAIDFLLSGTIDRLLGEGTGGVTLQQHGHHVDAKAEDAWVYAEVVLPGSSEPVTITRRLDSAQNPEIDERFAAQLNTVFTLARNGQHILTRREVLRYITAPASKRAERMQALLGIGEIKRVRDSLVRVRGEAKSKASATSDALLRAKSSIAATMKVKDFNEKELMAFVNEKRAFLQVKPLMILKASDIPAGINLSLIDQSERSLNPDILDRDIDHIHNQLSPNEQSKTRFSESKLREAIRQIHNQPALYKSLQLHQLTKLGYDLLEDSGECPLCDTPWPAGELREHLEHKLEKAKSAQQILDLISKQAGELSNSARVLIANVEKIAQAAKIIEEVEAEKELNCWRDQLAELVAALGDPVADYFSLPYTSEQITSLFADVPLIESVRRVQERTKELIVPVPPEQTTYQLLVRLSTELGSWEKAVIDDRTAHHMYQRAQHLLDTFERSRDQVLGSLYDNVRERFEVLYRQLHSSDESDFSAVLEPDGAGVAFEVDYYGRGKYPPNAIHSEGHQDSMGVCLFLALAEYINQGKLELVVLDDVLMAIDIDHRRAFSQMLKNAFPDRQFLITTHDRTWANQLRYQGVVNSKGFLEISHWDLVSGPRISGETDVWEKIEQDLVNHEIPVAASRLRRSSEEFYEQVCHHLKARVPYNMTGRYELGDLLPAAQSRYKELLKKAKDAANSWNDEEIRSQLSELDEVRLDVFSQLNAEQWAVNPAVHYNNWENFSPADFLPVVEAFQRLQSLFICPNCRGIIQFISAPPRSVRCNCNRFNWNLEKQ